MIRLSHSRTSLAPKAVTGKPRQLHRLRASKDTANGCVSLQVGRACVVARFRPGRNDGIGPRVAELGPTLRVRPHRLRCSARASYEYPDPEALNRKFRVKQLARTI